MAQRAHMRHLETIAQNVIGLLIGYLVCTQYAGMTTGESVTLQVIFFVLSYIRSYCIRTYFDYLENKHTN